MSNDESWEGKRINQYEVKQYITRGGMADIYEAYDDQLKRVVCLKIMQKDLLDDEAFVKRFQREARTAASLDHPDIVKIFDTGMTAANQPFIVMEYIPDGSLDRLTANGDIPWPLPPEQALKLIKRVAGALFVAHQRHIYHRDLKPQNILMRHKKQPVLTDFGVAAVEEGTKLTRTGEMPGTPYYMSPEQIRGEPVDGRSDIYALGIILYEMLAGSHPYAHLDPWRILEHQVLIEPPPLRLSRDGLTDATYQVVNTCLQKHAANRYQALPALIAALDVAIAQEEPDAVSQKIAGSAPPRQWRSFVRQNWLLLLLILLVVVLLVLTVVSMLPAALVETEAVQLQNNLTAPATGTPLLETPTSMEIIVVASPTLIPETVTPSMTPIVPTDTPVPPTETAVPPTVTVPFSLPAVAQTSAPPCIYSADSSWGEFVDAYKGELGCARRGVENLPYQLAAYQVFPEGLMIWRSDTELVYVLYNGGKLSALTIGAADSTVAECRDTLKNSFGWLWCNNPTVQTLGVPAADERNAPDFRAQDFDNGLIFTYSETNFYYVLLTTKGTWTAVSK